VSHENDHWWQNHQLAPRLSRARILSLKRRSHIPFLPLYTKEVRIALKSYRHRVHGAP